MRLWLATVLILVSCRSEKTTAREEPIARKPAAPMSLATEVGSNQATIWLRTSTAAEVRVLLVPAAPSGAHAATTAASNDFTASVRFHKLSPDTSYRYAVETEGARAAGQFRTAPLATEAKPVKFAWSGDLAGQNVCRDAASGFPIVGKIASTKPDFFVALGDMIYADGVCEATGLFGNKQVPGDFTKAATIESFWAHWRYNRADPGLAALLSSTSSYAIWDDHEVVNDFGPGRDTRDQLPYKKGEALLPIGLRAFLDYNPIAAPEAPLYRNFRWGKHLELVILDNRSHRDSNAALDNGDSPKTMLGAEQREWLKKLLAESDATWKVIVSSVPISIPTGSDPPDVARDGWAGYRSGQGFERELTAVLEVAAGVGANLLFITTDVHFASVFRYEPRLGKRPFAFHEAVVGPMSAGLFPSKAYDESFAPTRLFFHGPDTPEALTFSEALRFMSFGTVEISADGELSLGVVDGAGATLLTLPLSPSTDSR